MPTHFDQFGAYLALKTPQLRMTEEDLPFMRDWLDAAPTQASPGAMASWGRIMANLVQYLYKKSDLDPMEFDQQRLGAYFDRMTELPLDVWWTPGPEETHVHGVTGRDISVVSKPVYKAFWDVCYMLGHSRLEYTNPLLKQLVEDYHWNPTPVLLSLNAMRNEQIAHAYISSDFQLTIRDTAQGVFLQALRPLILDTSWRPEDTSLYGDMWLAHDNVTRNGNLRQSRRGREFALRFAKAVPSQTDKALQFLAMSNDISTAGIEDFFPLRLATCDALLTMHSLVSLFTDTESDTGRDKSAVVQAQLKRHHPEVLNLLKTHMSIFPEASKVSSMAEVLVNGFDTLRGRSPAAMMKVSSDVFDDGELNTSSSPS